MATVLWTYCLITLGLYHYWTYSCILNYNGDGLVDLLFVYLVK